MGPFYCIIRATTTAARGSAPLGQKNKKTRFSGFPPLSYVICVFAASLQHVFERFLLCGRTEEARSMMKSLRH